MAFARSVNMSGILAYDSSVREVNTSISVMVMIAELCTIANGQTPVLDRPMNIASIIL